MGTIYDYVPGLRPGSKHFIYEIFSIYEHIATLTADSPSRTPCMADPLIEVLSGS